MNITCPDPQQYTATFMSLYTAQCTQFNSTCTFNIQHRNPFLLNTSQSSTRTKGGGRHSWPSVQCNVNWHTSPKRRKSFRALIPATFAGPELSNVQIRYQHGGLNDLHSKHNSALRVWLLRHVPMNEYVPLTVQPIKSVILFVKPHVLAI